MIFIWSFQVHYIAFRVAGLVRTGKSGWTRRLGISYITNMSIEFVHWQQVWKWLDQVVTVFDSRAKYHSCSELAHLLTYMRSSAKISLVEQRFSLSSPTEQFQFLKRQRLVALFAASPQEIVDGLIHTSALSALRRRWRPRLVNLHLCEGASAKLLNKWKSLGKQTCSWIRLGSSQ